MGDSIMTDQDENIIVAEACGWVYDEHHGRGFWDNGQERISDEYLLSDRFETLDAMQQAVLMQDEEFQIRFHKNIISMCITRGGSSVKKFLGFHQLTATDWRSAFVETLKQLKRI